MTDHNISLSQEILSWTPLRQSSLVTEDQDWKKPYKYWNHAEELFRHCENEHYLVDCIGNIKRAIDHRLKQLMSLYLFKNIPDSSKPSEFLEILAYYRLAKPNMIREISKIRNLLEHHYKSPPPPKRCQELIEFSWYFLRSTDILSTSILTDFILHPDEEELKKENYWIEIKYGPEIDWKCEIRGWVPESFILNKITLGININFDKLETADEFNNRSISQNFSNFYHQKSGVYLIGRVLGGPGVFTELTSLYFSIL